MWHAIRPHASKQKNQSWEDSQVLGEHRLRRDATVLPEVMSFPVGYDVHLWLISLHLSRCQRVFLAGKSWISEAQKAQWSFMMQMATVPRASWCQLMLLNEADRTSDFLEDDKLIVDCLWTFILWPSFEVGLLWTLHIDWLSRDLFVFAGGNALRPGVPIPVHSFKLSAKTSAVHGERDLHNWKWWQAEIKHNQVQFTGQRSRSFWAFCLLSAAAHFCWHFNR